MKHRAAGLPLVDEAVGVDAFARRLGKIGRRKGQAVWFDHVSVAGQAFVAALVLREASRRESPPRVWLLTQDLRAQEQLANDLLTWWGPTLFFPEQEQDTLIQGLPDQDVQAERLAILQRLAESTSMEALVLNQRSLEETVPSPDALQKAVLELRKAQKINLAALLEKLEAAGYDKQPQAAERGQYAVRGGIIDIYSWQADLPVRIELCDDEIESIRTYDPDSQASVRRVNDTAILLTTTNDFDVTCRVADCIADGDWVVAVEVAECLRANVVITEQAALSTRTEENFDVACFEHPLGGFAAGDFVLQQARREGFTAQLDQWQSQGWRMVMFFNNHGEIERFRELMPLPEDKLALRLGSITHGFTVPAARLAVLSDAEVFGRYQTTKARRLVSQERRLRARRAPLDLSEIQLGDLVVHLDQGIAKYRGLTKRSGHDGLEEDVLVLEFAEEAKLYVPLQQAYMVSRYVGVGKTTPQLSKLGDARWGKAKQQAEKSIFDYAANLLRIQAERQTGQGFAHAPDTKWQWEFENSFIYKETQDQLRSIEETKRDMESVRPMDRLICGDVGFGKTEVAIRAAFKAVMSGKQVAILCPTTVLCQQHYQTFRERMSDYPLKIDYLNRFRSPKESREVLQNLANGSIDICIGTHRLISKDVRYKDLGLVVIDEEQRFGVKHKERFKELFHLVDVLTLSATPIPRTLYLSLMGARDMSTIETPPPNRLPVETTVMGYDERVIRKAIERELSRGGQVYFLHNRVASIELMADKIRALCPSARVEIGHGQMEEEDLENVMHRFVAGETDVLVCTTIIETGIDIPNANTIIIDRADRLGLADLYQLRGRVGRSGHKAYAYLMLPSGLFSTDARKRINAIKQYSSLGSGFKIAMRDLEIRGAGNLLGTQQSGHVIAIGFELYCQILKHAISSLKGTPALSRLEVALDLDFIATTEAAYQHQEDKCPAFIPAAYIEEPTLRIAAYKQVAAVTTQKEWSELLKNWQDRFGPLPSAAENLLRMVEIKLACHHQSITSLEVKGEKLMARRKGEYLTQQGKFPRLKSTDGAEKLQEIVAWLRGHL